MRTTAKIKKGAFVGSNSNFFDFHAVYADSEGVLFTCYPTDDASLLLATTVVGNERIEVLVRTADLEKIEETA